MPEKKANEFEVLILGGGITGSAVFHILSKYTSLKSIGLLEKQSELGQINSHANNNSQTLHFGDIESNYSLEKAHKTKQASEMVVTYLKKLTDKNQTIYSKQPKMLLAVGQTEVEILEKRFQDFSKLFPDLRKLEYSEIFRLEPNLIKGRDPQEKILALRSENGFVVDFGKLAQKMASDADPQNSKIFLNQEVLDIKKTSRGFQVITNNETFNAQTLVVSMCSQSLFFAKKLGYGHNFSILPIGGNFYACQNEILREKVYTMQSPKMPFAGVHGDPVLGRQVETRFGPTATLTFLLERKNWKTLRQFFQSSFSNFQSVRAFLSVIFERKLFLFLAQNLAYEIPFLGKYFYLKLCRKIVPTLQMKDFSKGKFKAGIRPQLIDNPERKLVMGEAEIVGDNIIFHISPSPGATVCLQNGEKTAKKVLGFFGDQFSFNQEKFEQDFPIAK